MVQRSFKIEKSKTSKAPEKPVVVNKPKEDNDYIEQNPIKTDNTPALEKPASYSIPSTPKRKSVKASETTKSVQKNKPNFHKSQTVVPNAKLEKSKSPSKVGKSPTKMSNKSPTKVTNS